jgi:sugar phosphate isomerase/epimerase
MTRRDLLKMTLAAPAVALRAETVGPARLGANTAIAGLGLLDAISMLRELRFPIIEIQAMGVLTPVAGRFPGFEFDHISAEEKKAIRAALKDFRHVTIHLPYGGLHYFDASPRGAADSLERLKRAMEGAAYFGCEIAVIHTTDPVGLTAVEAYPRMVESFRSWGDIAAKGGFRLAIETGTGGIDSSREFVRFVKEIDHPNVGCTLDVGHENRYREYIDRVSAPDRSTRMGITAYNDVIHEIVDGLGPKLIHFHVHDIDLSETWKDHVPVGTGVIDYPRLIEQLRRMQYGGFFILEIATPDMRSGLADSKRRMAGFLSLEVR